MQHIEKNLRSKVRRGALKTVTVLFLGYPRPQIYAERLDHPDSSWTNYTDYLRVLSEDVYWKVREERSLTCADTGLIRLVVLDDNLKHFVNLVDRTQLIGMYSRIELQFQYILLWLNLPLHSSRHSVYNSRLTPEYPKGGKDGFFPLLKDRSPGQSLHNPT